MTKIAAGFNERRVEVFRLEFDHQNPATMTALLLAVFLGGFGAYSPYAAKPRDPLWCPLFC